MAGLSTQMNVIVEKTRNLIQLCDALQEENDLLKLEVQSLQVAFQTSTDKYNNWRKRLRLWQLRKHWMNPR